jgi:hypothetical protein
MRKGRLFSWLSETVRHPCESILILAGQALFGGMLIAGIALLTYVLLVPFTPLRI